MHIHPASRFYTDTITQKAVFLFTLSTENRRKTCHFIRSIKN